MHRIAAVVLLAVGVCSGATITADNPMEYVELGNLKGAGVSISLYDSDRWILFIFGQARVEALDLEEDQDRWIDEYTILYFDVMLPGVGRMELTEYETHQGVDGEATAQAFVGITYPSFVDRGVPFPVSVKIGATGLLTYGAPYIGKQMDTIVFATPVVATPESQTWMLATPALALLLYRRRGHRSTGQPVILHRSARGCP
jgi:hypothetical protein